MKTLNIEVCNCDECRSDAQCNVGATLARTLKHARRIVRRNFCDICILALVCVTCYLLLIILGALEPGPAPIVPVF